MTKKSRGGGGGPAWIEPKNELSFAKGQIVFVWCTYLETVQMGNAACAFQAELACVQDNNP